MSLPADRAVVEQYRTRLQQADAEMAQAAVAYASDPTDEGMRNWAMYGAPGRRLRLLVEMPERAAVALGVRDERDAELARLERGRQTAAARDRTNRVR